MKSPFKKIISVISNILIWVVILAASIVIVLTVSTKDGVPTIFGASMLVVESPSMEGTRKNSFKENDLIVIKRLDMDGVNKLKVDDVISFWDFKIETGRRILNTHRIFEIKNESGQTFYVTKGDANTAPDNELRRSAEIIGKYSFKIPRAGYVMNFLKSTVGFFICLFFPILLFFIWRIYKLIVSIILYKKEQIKEKSAEETEVKITNENYTTIDRKSVV